jgi:hypothetical protein
MIKLSRNDKPYIEKDDSLSKEELEKENKFNLMLYEEGNIYEMNGLLYKPYMYGSYILKSNLDYFDENAICISGGKKII